jgi:hypothetical protein
LAFLRLNFNGYGLGFGVRDYRGKKVISHTGGLPGYVSKVVMIPELKLGVAVLTNQESGEAFEILTCRVLDYYLNVSPFDWLGAFLRIRARTDSSITAADLRSSSLRDSLSHPSLPLAAYAMTYTDPWYGDVIVTMENGKLRLRFSKTPSLIGYLEHWQYDTFVARWDDRELRADAFVTFALRPDGSVEQAKMKALSPSTDFSFDFQDLLLKPVRMK